MLAGLGFMLPGLVLILAISWLYGQLDLSRPPFAALFLGAQIGVVALIARAVHRIGGHVLEDRWLWGDRDPHRRSRRLAGVSFWITLPTAGLVYAAADNKKYAAGGGDCRDRHCCGRRFADPSVRIRAATASAAWPRPASIGALPLFLSGLKAGLLTFGGAYTAIPFVRDDAVGRGWVSEGQFLDGLALSGIIPAPLIIFATFVGYQAGGLAGAPRNDRRHFPSRLRLRDAVLRSASNGWSRTSASTACSKASPRAWSGSSPRPRSSSAPGSRAAVPSLPWAVAIFAACMALLYLWGSKLNVVAVVFLSAAAGLVAFG